MVLSFCKVLFLVLYPIVSVSFTYTDQKQNCTKHVTGSYCYNGPQFDAIQYKSCSVPNTLALTFDDGVDKNMDFYLDMLWKFNMKATFFIIGGTIQSNPKSIQRLVNEGHQLGAHTYTHPWLTSLTYNQTRQDFLNFENSVLQQNYQGVLANRMVPSYFRAPHGELPSSIYPLLKEFQVIPINWGFLNGDSTIKNSAEILPLWKSHLYNADESQLSVITQQHNVQAVTTASLYDVLMYLNTTFPNLRYVTVADCLGNVVPPYHVSPIHQEDPQCKNGILKMQSGKAVCCMASCATGTGSASCTGVNCCGGNGCGARPGGTIGCCADKIIAANITCVISGAPCLVM